jgi:hypothetical protein
MSHFNILLVCPPDTTNQNAASRIPELIGPKQAWQIGWPTQRHMLTTKPNVSEEYLISADAVPFGNRPEERRGCDGCRKVDLDLEWMSEQYVRIVQERWRSMLADHGDTIALLYKHGFEQESTLESEVRFAAGYFSLNYLALVQNGQWTVRAKIDPYSGYIDYQWVDSDWRKIFIKQWEQIPDDNIVVGLGCPIRSTTFAALI